MNEAERAVVEAAVHCRRSGEAPAGEALGRLLALWAAVDVLVKLRPATGCACGHAPDEHTNIGCVPGLRGDVDCPCSRTGSSFAPTEDRPATSDHDYVLDRLDTGEERCGFHVHPGTQKPWCGRPRSEHRAPTEDAQPAAIEPHEYVNSGGDAFDADVCAWGSKGKLRGLDWPCRKSRYDRSVHPQRAEDAQPVCGTVLPAPLRCGLRPDHGGDHWAKTGDVPVFWQREEVLDAQPARECTRCGGTDGPAGWHYCEAVDGRLAQQRSDAAPQPAPAAALNTMPSAHGISAIDLTEPSRVDVPERADGESR